MDVRAKIVDKVLENLPELDPDLRDKVERTLLLSLQDYEVQERCTDVVVHDDSSLGLVRKFIATKKLEGKSDRTLRRYQPELEKLVLFLNKKLFEVSPYDLRLYLSLYKDRRKVSSKGPFCPVIYSPAITSMVAPMTMAVYHLVSSLCNNFL